VEIRARDAAEPFVTTDGSTIRSLLDLSNAPVAHQSLAEATIAAGDSTVRHHHRVSEEIYYIVEGSAVMEIDGEERPVTVGDAVLIPPGAWHTITATDAGPVRLLCACAPPWAAADTYFT
jgi:mannose-6-phosphate isomerase-like protein (cupin superfamily)